VAVDPRDAHHVWVAVQSPLDDPDGGLRNDVLESRDGGATWSAPFAKPDGGDLTAASGETLYTHGGVGLWVSHDGGQTWAARDRGIVGGDLRSGLVAQRLPGGGSGRRLVALNAAGYGAAGPVLYRSDGGRDWLATPLQPAAVAGAGASTVVAADGDGVERSLDGGATWSFVPSAPLAHAFLPDLAQPRYLALVAFEDAGAYGTNALWTSDDAGATWRRAGDGLPTACTHVASVDECAFAARALCSISEIQSRSVLSW
jgi:photosystem II stability/assembly factor-like uncharacterized protein